MKKVRLFAVAAAMGMFAASVSAAGPVLTKDAYKATWGTMDEIVRAEIGGKVVLPTPNVSVTKQTRSTDPEKATSTGGLFGSTLNNNCYVGLTDTLGTDSNSDGLVDYNMLFVTQEDGHTWGTSGSFWYYDDLKFWPTVKTSLYYIGMTGNGLGARFIAPNAAAEKGWIVSSTHTKYATEADVLAYLETKGLVELVENTKGEVDKINVNKTTIVNKDDSKIKLGDAWVEYAAKNERYGIEELAERIVGLFDGKAAGSSLAPVTKYVNYYTEATKAKPVFSADDTKITVGTAEADDLLNKILVVEENRYGELIPVAVHTTNIVDADLNLLVEAKSGSIVVAIMNDDDDYTKYSTITPKDQTSGQEFGMEWNIETGSFDKVAVVKSVADGAPAWLADAGLADVAALNTKLAVEGIKTAGGLYKYDNPANTTDKIVVNYDLGVYGENLNVAGINTTKGTITLVDAAGDELVTSAVKLGNKWYPTVNNVDELGVFVKRMAGLYTPTGNSTKEEYKDIYTALKAKKAYSTITWLDGTKNVEYIPENPKAHYKAQQCTYVSDETAVDAASVVVTNNAASIDTNQYGVHTVTLTAKVGEATVGTKDVKVVIAPKYVREYKNGRVTSLKAYHLNGNLYSHTTFDYTAKKSTAVFYNQDGVTAIETQTNDIK